MSLLLPNSSYIPAEPAANDSARSAPDKAATPKSLAALDNTAKLFSLVISFAKASAFSDNPSN